MEVVVSQEHRWRLWYQQRLHDRCYISRTSFDNVLLPARVTRMAREGPVVLGLGIRLSATGSHSRGSGVV